MNNFKISDLPEIRLLAPRSEPDYYGASDLIATKLGLPLPPPISDVSWFHGWRYQNMKYSGELILRFNQHMSRHLVATDFQSEFLKSQGYKDVNVVGTPFAYFLSDDELYDTSKVIPNSILVMPPHSTNAIDTAPVEMEYINFLRDSVGKDKFICFCVHQDCEARGYWVPTLKKCGIPYVTGASIWDRNGLKRMAAIYKHFEAMTTNVFGSHILQASLCGLKVSVCGPEYVQDYSSIVKSTRWLYRKSDLLAYSNIIEGSNLRLVRNQYPQFFTPIEEARNNQQWAIKESGYDRKKSWEELYHLLGWDHSFKNWLDYYTLRFGRLAQRDLGFFFSKLVS